MPRRRLFALDHLVLGLVLIAGCDPAPEPTPEDRGCDKCAPPPEIPAHPCTDRPIIDVAGDLDPNSADVSADLQAAIEWADSNGWAAGLSPGVYRLAKPLRLPSNAHFIGSGPDTVLLASTVPGAWEHDQAMIELVGVDDVEICGMTLDHDGKHRFTESQHLSSTVLISNAYRNHFEEVVFRNPGVSYKADVVPDSTAVLMIAREKGDAPYHAQGDVGELGSAVGNIIENSRFEIEEVARSPFAVRMHSDYSQRRTFEEFAVELRGNDILDNTFVGDFHWNTIEIAGAGSWDNWVNGNTFDGHTLTHVDLGKGTHRNKVEGNEIVRAGRPAWLTNPLIPPGGGEPVSPRTFALADHGIDADYRNEHNEIRANHIALVDEQEPYPAEHVDSGAILMEHAYRSRMIGNDIDDVFGGRIGAGIVLGSNVFYSDIFNNDIGLEGSVLYGIRTPEGGDGTIDVWTWGNDIVALEGGISIGVKAAGPAAYSWILVMATDVSVPATSPMPAVAMEGDAMEIYQSRVDGGRNAIYSSSIRMFCAKNEAGGSADYTFRILGNSTFEENIAYGTGRVGSAHPHCGLGTGVVDELDNNFVCGPE